MDSSDLTDNFLLEPTTMIQRSYTGNVRGKKIRGHSDSVGPFKDVVFDRHSYYIEAIDGGVATYRKLVATVTSNYPADDIVAFEERIRPIVNDYLLISSFAANQRTNIISWYSVDEKHLVRGWYGNAPVETRQEGPLHGYDDCLISRSEFKKFIKIVTKRFADLSDDDKQLIRRAIYKVLPREVRTVESSILSFFSAIESIVLIHRRAKDLEFTVSKSNRWKKLEHLLRQTINSQNDLFATSEHMEMLLNMLPLLKRVSLKDAFESYLREEKVDLSDLWPVFDSNVGASLTDIRNRIIHGDAFDERNWLPLCHAMNNLECVTKRLILAVLGWDIERSNVSKDLLRRGGWIANSNLSGDMQALAGK